MRMLVSLLHFHAETTQPIRKFCTHIFKGIAKKTLAKIWNAVQLTLSAKKLFFW